MKKTIRTITEIENWNRGKCEYCEDIPDSINATHYVKVRNIKTNKLVVGGCLCLSCKEKFENNQFEMCPNCERVFKRGEKTWKTCLCADAIDDDEPRIEPERYSTQLEKQIHELSLDKEVLEDELETERDAHLAGIGASSDFHKRVFEEEKQMIEERRRRLSDENKSLKTRVAELEKQVNKLNLENGTLKSGLATLKSQISLLDIQIEQIEERHEAKIEFSPLKN